MSDSCVQSAEDGALAQEEGPRAPPSGDGVGVPFVGWLVAGMGGTVLPAQSRSPATDTLPFENPPSLPEVGFVRLVSDTGRCPGHPARNISDQFFLVQRQNYLFKNSF